MSVICHITFILVNTLLDLSSMVRTLSVDQRQPELRDRDANFFFGIQDVDWAPIFMEMLTRRVDKLRILNGKFPKFLPEKSIDKLKKVRIYLFRH